MEGRLILLVLMAFVTPGMVWGNTWSWCGASQLCVTSPSGCDPHNQTCLYASATNVSMSNTTFLCFNLVGNPPGNITLVLSDTSTNFTTNFTCGQNASNSFYFSSPLTNQTMINSQGSVNSGVINCTFNFTVASISSIFNISDLAQLVVSLSSSSPSPTTTPTNSTVNGTAATNTTITTTTTTTLRPSTTKPTGASVALHPYASLLLSLVSLSVLQKV